MAARVVGYFIKGTRPTDLALAQSLQTLAYQAATKIDPDVREILIRGLIHSTTKKDGKWVPDKRHLTFSFRTTALIDEDKFFTAHAYTKGTSYELAEAKSDGPSHPMDLRHEKKGTLIWPENLSSEDIFHVDPPAP